MGQPPEIALGQGAPLGLLTARLDGPLRRGGGEGQRTALFENPSDAGAVPWEIPENRGRWCCGGI